jgi:hypothetical protein
MTKREVVFGTTNEAKINQMRSALMPRDIGVLAPREEPEKVVEDGATVEENARKKARAFAKVLGRAAFSVDNGLYFEGLADDLQPGQEVRRIDGKDWASDREMLEYYPRLIGTLGDRVAGRWEYGVALARPDGSCVSTMFVTLRIFTPTPSKHVIAKYPLESLQIDPATGIYIADMTEDEQAAFWQVTVGGPVGDFLEANL